MIARIRYPKIERLSLQIRSHGRVLYPVCDVDLVRLQVMGTKLEITPETQPKLPMRSPPVSPPPAVHASNCDDSRRAPLSRSDSWDRSPHLPGTVKTGRFAASVCEKRVAGKQSPYTEPTGRARPLVADDIDGLYSCNGNDLAVSISTTFDRTGWPSTAEPIPFVEITEGADEITRRIVENDVLFATNVARLRRPVSAPTIVYDRTGPKPRARPERRRAPAPV